MGQSDDAQDRVAAVNSIPVASLRRRSRRRWIFRTLAVLFPCFVLILLEVFLRWSGFGIDCALVLPSRRDHSLRIRHLNPQADRAYCVEELRGPEPRGFELPKPADLIRVIVVGASTVQGYPYPSELSFPRQLELVLQRQLPEKRIEVLNAGIVGLSTTPLVDVVSQCHRAEPDAVVFYEGHNEFYGVGGVATNSEISPWGIRFRHLRLGQWLTTPRSREERSEDSELITRLPKSYRIPAESPFIEAAERKYRRNLTRIGEICQARGIPLLLCTPVSNLRDQSPMVDREQLSQLHEVEDRVAQGGMTTAQTSEILKRAAVRFPANPILHFRLAQEYERQGDVDDARKHYRLARDFDLCRYRASSSCSAICREIAEGFPDVATLVDLETAFDEDVPDRIPGRELFLEHVHFTLEGHWLVARTVGRQVLERVCRRDWNGSLVPSPEDRDEFLGLIPEDLVAGFFLAKSLSETPPFNQVVDAAHQPAILDQRIAATVLAIPEEELRVFMSVPTKMKMDDLLDGIGRARLELGEPARALEYFEKSMRRRPWYPNAFVFAAVCRTIQGNRDEARRLLTASESTVLPESSQLLQDKERLLREVKSQ